MSQPLPTHGVRAHADVSGGPGIVFAVSRFVMEHLGNISASQQFDDRLTDRSSCASSSAATPPSVETSRQEFAAVASEFAMASSGTTCAHRPGRCSWSLDSATASTTCCFGRKTGALNIEIPLIVSNHRDFEGVADARDPLPPRASHSGDQARGRSQAP